MIVRPFLIARYGVYLALLVAALSAFWAHSAGYSIDGALMRSVFVFVIFVALAFGAEAVLISGPVSLPGTGKPEAQPVPEQPSPETEDE